MPFSRNLLLRARWLLLLLPVFALASTLQVGCVGGTDQRDDYVHEDPQNGNPAGYPNGNPHPKPTIYGYDDDYPYYGGYGDDWDNGYGY